MGKRIIGTHKISCKTPKNKEIVSENSKKKIKIFSFPLIYFALSGTLTASSFMSVSLLRLYILKIIKNTDKIRFKINRLNNKHEKKTLREPLIAKKREVEIRNDANLFSLLLNPFFHTKEILIIPTAPAAPSRIEKRRWGECRISHYKNLIYHFPSLSFDSIQTVQYPNEQPFLQY